MNNLSKLEIEIIETIKDYNDYQVYNLFGSRLEEIVILKRLEYQKLLKKIWKNRTKYSFNDTGQLLDKDSMSYFFDIKRLTKYTLFQMEKIIEDIENQLRIV
jgi:hypothetical protein